MPVAYSQNGKAQMERFLSAEFRAELELEKQLREEMLAMDPDTTAEELAQEVADMRAEFDAETEAQWADVAAGAELDAWVAAGRP
jgi:hypothetical protein